MRFIAFLCCTSLISSVVPLNSSAEINIQLPLTAVTGHYDNAIGTSDAASQGVVTSNLIGNRAALRTGELLEFVPGMIVSQHSGDGKANQYYLRGFNLDHGTDFATYVDDIPVNMRTHAHGQGYTDLNFIIPELVNRIDYSKGPYSATEGDFSSAGAAHLRLANRLSQGIVSVSAGQDGYRRTVIADSFGLGNGTLLYGLEANRNDGPWDSPEDVRKYSGMLRYSKGTSDDGYNITAMAYHNCWNSTDQIPMRSVRSGYLSRYGAIDPSDGGVSSRYSIAFAMHKRNGYGMFEFSTYGVQSSLDLFSNFTYFLNDPVNGDQFSQSERRKMTGFNMSQIWSATFLGREMHNKLGLQTRYDDLSPLSLYNTASQERISLIRSDKVKEGSTGVYAQNTLQWLEKFRTIVGIRYDSYSFDVDSSNSANSGKTHDGIASPKLSLIFGPWASTEYFLNYGKGFHSNDARGTTQTQFPSGGGSSPVNPLVATKGSEIGLRTQIIPGLQSSLAVWKLDIDSELVFVGDAGETEPNRASRRHGAEWSNHYIANSWLLFDLDMAVSRTRYSEKDPAGDHIPGSVNRVASFGATITSLGNWYGALQVRHFGPRPLVEDNRVHSGSTTIAYARIGYRLDPRTRLTLDVFNLFDRKDSDIDYYYASRLNGEPATGINDIHFHPVEPRTARLTLSYNF